MMHVYFCWLCQQTIADIVAPITDVHYESERVLHFCCLGHWREYHELADVDNYVWS